MTAQQECPDDNAGAPNTEAVPKVSDSTSIADQGTRDGCSCDAAECNGTMVSFDELLRLLRFTGDEFVSVCHKIGKDSRLYAAVMSPNDAPAYVENLAIDRADVWFGINPVRGPARIGRRGRAQDVTRLACLPADLDVTESKCPTLDAAHYIIDDVSGKICQRPVAVTSSGHGLQPLWAVSGGQIGDGFTTEQAKALLDWFKQLVKDVAHQHGCKVDSVFDLPRILRVPGTFNCKDIWA
jgi:hypothetical protein